MNNLMIMTVGAGVGERGLSLAASLTRSIAKLGPRRYWLVPSAAPDSIALAGIIRDEVEKLSADPPVFVPWSSTSPFLVIQDADDLDECRTGLREVLRVASREARDGEIISLNPTSGTKQMSVAATLCAFEEGAGQLVFTTGPRMNGLVIDGMEELRKFSLQAFFLERDTRIARELFRQGAFRGAARLLETYSDASVEPLRARALCYHHWQRLAYGVAASHIRASEPELAQRLDYLSNQPPISLAVAGDILASAEACLRWDDAEDALARTYNACERLAKCLLIQRGSTHENMREFNFSSAWRELQKQGDPSAFKIFQPRIYDHIMKRNDTVFGHGRDGSDLNQTRLLIKDVLDVARTYWPQMVSEYKLSMRSSDLT